MLNDAELINYHQKGNPKRQFFKLYGGKHV